MFASSFYDKASFYTATNQKKKTDKTGRRADMQEAEEGSGGVE